MMAFTSSGFWVKAQCVAATSALVRFGRSASIFLLISGFKTESYVAWTKSEGVDITFLSSSLKSSQAVILRIFIESGTYASSSSQLLFLVRYQFTAPDQSFDHRTKGISDLRVLCMPCREYSLT